MATKRINEIDISKGIGILLVIIGHSLPEMSETREWIYSFHMPLFFLLTGLVINLPEKWDTKAQIAKERTLITNYMVWSCVYWVFDFAIRYFIMQKTSLISLLCRGYQTICLYGINVLWFISTLIIGKLMTKWICSRVKNQRLQILIFISLYALSSIIATVLPETPTGKAEMLIVYPSTVIVRSFTASAFIYAGHMLKGAVHKLINSTSLVYSLLIGGCAIFITIMAFRLVGYVDIHVLRYGNSVLLAFNSVAALVGVICIAKIFNQIYIFSKFFTFLGENSLLIMLTHEYLMIKTVIAYVTQLLVPNINPNLYVFIEITALVATESLICILFGRKINSAIGKINEILSRMLDKRHTGKEM